jgi:hypothetical protein
VLIFVDVLFPVETRYYFESEGMKRLTFGHPTLMSELGNVHKFHLGIIIPKKLVDILCPSHIHSTSIGK